MERQEEASWIGVGIMRKTVRELASRWAKSEAYFAAKWTKQCIQEITDVLQILSQREVPPAADMASLTEARDKLLKHQEYIYQFRQEQIERTYKRYVSHLKSWLPASEKALAMLNIPHLESLERDLKLPSDGSLPDRAVRIAATVQIFCPMFGGSFDANASRLAITLYHGITDCFFISSRIICAAAIRDGGKGNRVIRHMRHYPKECTQAANLIRKVLQLATGRLLSVSVPELTSPAQISVAAELSQAAIMFVVFHELAHILLEPSGNDRVDEYACDAFATHLLAASRDPMIVCGVSIGFLLTCALLVEGGNFNESETHPSFGRRLTRFSNLLNANGMALSEEYDALLQIPFRTMEIELFKTNEISIVCIERYRKRLQNTREEISSMGELATALANMVGLPPMSKVPCTFATSTNDGTCCRLVEFNFVLAIKLVKKLLKTDIGTAEMLVLEFIAAIAGKPPPTTDDVRTLEPLIRAQDKSKRKLSIAHQTPPSLDEALLVLGRLGCATTSDQKIGDSLIIAMPTRTAGFSFEEVG